MIDLITGVPGSGKTYYAVYRIYDLITAKEKKYKHIYTNINGFDYALANKLANESDYVKPFEFADLRSHMETEYLYHMESKDKIAKSIRLKEPVKPDKIVPIDIYSCLSDDKKKEVDKRYSYLLQKYEEDLLAFNEQKKQNISNNERLEKLKKDYDKTVKNAGVYNIFIDSLIILDECHLYFEERADEVLIRFLSYHRHFDIDMYLITQNKNLINKKYLSFIETMFVAYPASKRLFSKTFRYKKYASYQEYHANIMGTISFTLKKNVFQLYSSGSNTIGKSYFSKMALPVVIVLLLSVFAYMYLSHSLSPDKPVKPTPAKKLNKLDTNITKVSNDGEPTTAIPDELADNAPFYIVSCYSDSCVFRHTDTSFPKAVSLKIIDKFKCKIIFTDSLSPNFVIYTIRCNSNFKEFLKLYKSSELNHEKTTSRANPLSHSLKF